MALSRPAPRGCLILLSLFALLGWGTPRVTAAPPVVRSTSFDGSYTSIVHYAVEPWMNTNTVALTVEAWVYCRDLLGFQALVARHYTTNLWFGLNGSRLRFYRSGGMLADSDATLVANRWTHVAVTYDGTTARFYVNGVAGGVKTLGHAGNNCTNTLSLGGQWDRLNAGDTNTAGYAFNGWLDEVRIWTVARTGAAIAGGMDQEVRVGAGLAAVFAEGGQWNEVTGIPGDTMDPPADRESGFGVLPRTLCIPYTTKSLVADGTIDLLNEYRGAEALVLRSRLSTNAPDAVAYLMVSRSSTNYHLFVGVPSLPQAGGTNLPLVQVQADVNPTNGTGLALGDWECRLDQDGLQGGRIYGVSPPFFPDPTWLSWGQGASNWQAATVSPFEFQQNYEFRIHGRHLNSFTNDIGLLVRYYDYDALGDQLAGPRDAVTNQPVTYARASWCGAADAPTVNLTIRCSVTNITTGAGVSNLAVAVYSGESELSGQLLRSFRTGPAGTLSAYIEAPRGAPIVVSYAPPANVNQLPPVLPYFGPDYGVSALGPASIRIGYPATCSVCGYYPFEGLQFRFSERGPVGVTGLAPSELPALVTVRTNPVKLVGGGSFTVLGSNLTAGVQVYLRGPGCSLSPPSLCTSDWAPAPITSMAPDGSSLVATVPPGLTWYQSGARAFQVVVENPGYLTTGGNRWNYGPSLNVVAPAWPLLNGFEFINRDDGPSVEEFEACYEYSIFTPLGFRDPYYGLWASLYLIWMEALKGSCYGFSGTSALMADGSLARQAYDQAGADGVRGVRYPYGYLGVFPCVEGTNVFEGRLCPPKPGRWTGFELFQPYRPVNLWSRITSLAGAQTSAEAIVGILSQLGTPAAFGARRGLASANPVDVLNRLRSAPGQYTLCVQKRDFGDGHCITPYGIVEDFGLDTDAALPVANTNKSLIRVYDNNYPGQERFIEVDRYFNIFRYNSGIPRVGLYEGPGLFFTSLSTYRGPRHALDPFSLGRLGVDYLRTLLSGTAAAAWQDGSGGRAGWTAGGLTNTYGGALPYLPVGLLPEGAETAWDTTMYFLPGSNAPVSGTFASAGSNVLVYAAMGWGDIAYGFRAANTGATHVVDGLVTKPGEGLTALGLRASGSVAGFSAMTASRDSNGQSRVLLLDAGAGSASPDLLVERDGLRDVRVRNRGTSALSFRVALAGADATGRVFDQTYGSLALPANATLRLIFPTNVLSPTLVRELDTNNDGAPEEVEALAGAGQVRMAREGGLLAMRWREAGFGGVLESSPRVSPASWSPANAAVTTEGADRVARVSPGTNGGVFRVRFPGTNCLAFASLAAGPRPNPWSTNGFQMEAFGATGAALAQNTVTNRSGYSGLDVAQSLTVVPPSGTGAVTLEVFNPQGALEVEAVGPLGAVLTRQTLALSAAGPQTVMLRGYRGTIQLVRVKAMDKPAILRSVCAELAAP